MAYRATGKIKRIYPYSNGAYVQLDYEGLQPRDQYFHLSTEHANYSSLYALIVTAAVNRYQLSIRTDRDISPEQHGEIRYVVIDW